MGRGILVTLLIIGLSSRAYGQIDLDIISEIESSGGKRIYNAKSGALGEMQITPVCLREFNERCHTDVRRGDLRNKEIARRIARFYFEKRIPQILKAAHVKPTKERVLAAYNGGARRVIRGARLPKETRNYIKRYRILEKRKGYIK